MVAMNLMFRSPKNADNPFTMMDNRTINDERLSFGAKGVLLYLLSKKDNWTPIIIDIEKHNSRKEHYVRSAIKELIDYGYIERKKIREKGRFVGTEYIIFENPSLREDFTTSRFSTCGKSGTNNTNNSNIKKEAFSKNENADNQNDETKGDESMNKHGDGVDWELMQLKNAKLNPYSAKVEGYPIHYRKILTKFLTKWNLPVDSVPSKQEDRGYTKWLTGLKDLHSILGEGKRVDIVIDRVYNEYVKKTWVVSWPGAIYNNCVSALSELNREDEAKRKQLEDAIKAQEEDVLTSVFGYKG